MKFSINSKTVTGKEFWKKLKYDAEEDYKEAKACLIEKGTVSAGRKPNAMNKYELL